MLPTTLKHMATQRSCVVLGPALLADARPYATGPGKYVLVLASASPSVILSIEQARRWIDAGAAYVCTWGPKSQIIEETFDHAGFSPDVGEALNYTLMTTSHVGETLDEALRFAFWCALPPDDLSADLNLVVIQTDSPALAAQARAWVESNHA